MQHLSLSRSRIQRRLGLALATLALLAQWAMVQAGAGHWGQRLWEMSLRSDICSVHTSAWTTVDVAQTLDDEQGKPAGAMPSCPLCTAVALGLGLPPALGAIFVALAQSAAPPPWADSGHIPRAPAFAHPPAQAPPRI